ncbi:MAG: hypothetical protein MZV64_73995 [Ignavibacteriales bacterium]|nr:hypothetical protein [Ignavibacteriales bacterium]
MTDLIQITKHLSTFQKFQLNWNHFQDLEILSLFVDRSGILWAGSHLGEGVTKIQNIIRSSNQLIDAPPGSLKLNDDVVWSLFKDSKDNLWVGTYRGGVNVLNFTSKQTRIYKKSPDGKNSISDNHIRSLAEDKLGNIWIGTYSGGLNRVDKSGQKVEVFKNEPGNSNSLSANQVLDIYIESENKIWIATFGGGLKQTYLFMKTLQVFLKLQLIKTIHLILTRFQMIGFTTILRDSKNNFWIGTYGGGLNKFDEQTGSFKVFSQILKIFNQH